MTSFLAAIAALPVWAVYGVVTGLVFGEAAIFIGLVLPGETALLFGGALAGSGHLSLSLLTAFAVTAAILGDSVGYEVGRRLGPTLTQSRAGRLVGERRWARTEAVMMRRGGWAVLTGRWVGVLRALMPAIAGMTRMPYRRFLVFNAIGGAVWAVAVAIAGYLAGASWQRVQTYLGNVGLLVLAGFVVAVLALLLGRRLLRRRRDSPPGSAGRRRSRRQPEVEDRPAVVVGAGQVVGDGDVAPVPGDDLAADRQPEA
jgi:membrane protein DedA with SNARE-associated domain